MESRKLPFIINPWGSGGNRVRGTIVGSWGVIFPFLFWYSHFSRIDAIQFSGISYHTMCESGIYTNYLCNIALKSLILLTYY